MTYAPTSSNQDTTQHAISQCAKVSSTLLLWSGIKAAHFGGIVTNMSQKIDLEKLNLLDTDMFRFVVLHFIEGRS